MPLEHIRLAVIERLRHERTLCDALRSRALKLAQTGLDELPKKSPLFVDGASSLLDEAGEDSGITLGTLSALLRMVEEKERLVKLLNSMDGPGLTIVIGHEHRTPISAHSASSRNLCRRHAAAQFGVIGRCACTIPNHRRCRRRCINRVAGPPRQHVIRVRAMADQKDAPSLQKPLKSNGWTTKAERRDNRRHPRAR
jgi:hypothetical protein